MNDCQCGHSVLLHRYGFGRCFICAWNHIVISASVYDDCPEFRPTGDDPLTCDCDES